MRNFEGFIKKAVVIVPTDEEFSRRTEKREKEEGKDVPDSAVMEMKGKKHSKTFSKTFFTSGTLFIMCTS